MNSPPAKPHRTNGKRVTFNLPHSKSSAVSGPASVTVDNTGSPGMITSNTGSTGLSVDSTEENIADAEKELNIEQEMIKKVSSKARKSICRIQPVDSLSTSSGNMFQEEELKCVQDT